MDADVDGHGVPPRRFLHAEDEWRLSLRPGKGEGFLGARRDVVGGFREEEDL